VLKILIAIHKKKSLKAFNAAIDKSDDLEDGIFSLH